MASLTRSDVEIANRGADEFLRVYYATYDSAQRAEGVPKFYRETSCLTYNGTAVTGPDAIKQLLERLPITKHEVQSYDCHPISSEPVPYVDTRAHLQTLHSALSYIPTSTVNHGVGFGDAWVRVEHRDGGVKGNVIESGGCAATRVLTDVRADEEGEILCFSGSFSICRVGWERGYASRAMYWGRFRRGSKGALVYHPRTIS